MKCPIVDLVLAAVAVLVLAVELVLPAGFLANLLALYDSKVSMFYILSKCVGEGRVGYYLLALLVGAAVEGLVGRIVLAQEINVNLNIEVDVDVDETSNVQVDADIGSDIESNEVLVNGDPVVAVLLLAVVTTMAVALAVLVNVAISLTVALAVVVAVVVIVPVVAVVLAVVLAIVIAAVTVATSVELGVGSGGGDGSSGQGEENGSELHVCGWWVFWGEMSVS